MNKLHNCPNCAGYLNDSGRCEFCGSKVYDFVNVDFDEHARTYIRIKSGGKIMTMPVIFHTANIDIHSEQILTDVALGYLPYAIPCWRRTGVLEFDIIGDTVTEANGDTERT